MIMGVAQSMTTNGMQAAGYDFVLLDDCWVRKSITLCVEKERKGRVSNTCTSSSVSIRLSSAARLLGV